MRYPSGVKGYRVCNKLTGQFFNSHDIVFDENPPLACLHDNVPGATSSTQVDSDSNGDGELPSSSSADTPSTVTPVSIATAPLLAAVLAADLILLSVSTLVNNAATFHPLHCSGCAQTLTEAGHAFQGHLKQLKAHSIWLSPLNTMTSSPVASALLDLSPLSSLTPFPESPASSPFDLFPFSETVVNLVITEHANLAIHSSNC
ncbi:hypothetical protein J3A83DRAFT_4503066 [Scleroderma citrinum]